MISRKGPTLDASIAFNNFFWGRVPRGVRMEPRSSRLKDKKKGEGEMLVKDLFVQDVMQNNDLLYMLAEGSSVVILPQNSVVSSFSSNSKAGSQSQVQPGLFPSLGSPDLMMKTTKSLLSEGIVQERKRGVLQGTGSCSMKETVSPSCFDKRLPCSVRGNEFSALASESKNMETEKGRASRGDRLSEQGLFSCVTCGILCFACVALLFFFQEKYGIQVKLVTGFRRVPFRSFET